MVDGAVRGNYGLMDQVAALHWIQENVGELAGDTHNVTVIGHGFGANCVHLLMISPMARGMPFPIPSLQLFIDSIQSVKHYF